MSKRQMLKDSLTHQDQEVVDTTDHRQRRQVHSEIRFSFETRQTPLLIPPSIWNACLEECLQELDDEDDIIDDLLHEEFLHSLQNEMDFPDPVDEYDLDE
mmetsp:Transcript_25820/g.39559  ORF Transcript_25820/g.39559 Transcript_25820/m.39559 type:complete len:100 (+) Transcript_25820:447-746(+)